MKRFILTFLRNLRFLGMYDIQQMIDFEQELLESNNGIVEHLKAVDFLLNKEAGYDSGRFLRPRPGHINLLTRVNRPLTLPLEIAGEVEQYLESCDAQARLAREKQEVEERRKAAGTVAVMPRLRKARRRRAKR